MARRFKRDRRGRFADIPGVGNDAPKSRPSSAGSSSESRSEAKARRARERRAKAKEGSGSSSRAESRSSAGSSGESRAEAKTRRARERRQNAKEAMDTGAKGAANIEGIVGRVVDDTKARVAQGDARLAGLNASMVKGDKPKPRRVSSTASGHPKVTPLTKEVKEAEERRVASRNFAGRSQTGSRGPTSEAATASADAEASFQRMMQDLRAKKRKNKGWITD